MNPRLLLRLRPSPRSRSRGITKSYTSRILFHTTTHPRQQQAEKRQPSSSSSSSSSSQPTTPARKFPTVEECPAPTCECAPAPDLEIDRKSKLAGVFVPYVEQVLVCTGRDDWASRVEEDEGADGGGEVLRGFKSLFGRGGRFADPYHNISFLASSFPSSPGPNPSAYLLPSFTYIPSIAPSPSSLTRLSKSLLLPETLHTIHASLPPESRAHLTRDPSLGNAIPSIPVQDVMILICGHASRDLRCGVLGPLLREEFRRVISREDGISLVEDDQPPTQPEEEDGMSPTAEADSDGVAAAKRDSSRMTARVGLVSHIGGHKFAGNVIVYVPPGATVEDEVLGARRRHPLAGCGVWYGRVGPENVEGIVRETVRKGNVILEHFRGGLDSERRIMRV